MLEQQLRQLAADAPEVDPSTSVADVVRRGRIRLAVSRLLGGVAAAAVVTAGVVTVPLMLDGPMPSPEVLDAEPVDDAIHQGEGSREDAPTRDASADPGSVDAAHPLMAITFDVDIRIVSPETGHQVDAEEIVVEGVVEPGARVWVSGITASVDGSTFRAVVPLEPGKQKLRAFARIGDDRAGVDEILVVRQDPAAISEPASGKEPTDGTKPGAVAGEADGKPEDEPTADTKPDDKPDVKPEPADTAFTAVQVHDHAEGEPPVGLYEGTGPAGYWVKVWSEYGWGKQQIPDSGEWRIEVAFDGAPPGTQTWSVVAWLLDTEHERGFEFTGTRSGSSSTTEFTAVQVKADGEGDPPWAVYEGTGPAGSWVKAYSDYGWGKIQIGPSGEWRLEVAFHDAPVGKPFQVEVHSLHTGESIRFDFERIG